MIIELVKRGMTLDGPAITMFRVRTSLSHSFVAGGKAAMYSGVWRVRVKDRLQ